MEPNRTEHLSSQRYYQISFKMKNIEKNRKKNSRLIVMTNTEFSPVEILDNVLYIERKIPTMIRSFRSGRTLRLIKLYEGYLITNLEVGKVIYNRVKSEIYE